jgi:hypothetical protein
VLDTIHIEVWTWVETDHDDKRNSEVKVLVSVARFNGYLYPALQKFQVSASLWLLEGRGITWYGGGRKVHEAEAGLEGGLDCLTLMLGSGSVGNPVVISLVITTPFGYL